MNVCGYSRVSIFIVTVFFLKGYPPDDFKLLIRKRVINETHFAFLKDLGLSIKNKLMSYMTSVESTAFI